MKINFISIILSNFLLLLGITSLLLIVEGDLNYAALLILLAGVYDYFEDDILDFLKISGEDGDTRRENSPAKLLVFAISPLILIYLLFDFGIWGFLGVLPLFLFSMASLYQLKATHFSGQKESFFLLPNTYAAVALSILSLVLQESINLRFIVYAILIVFSYLMIRPNKF